MTSNEIKHYENSLGCLKIGNFYSKAVFFLNARDLFKDLASSLSLVGEGPDVTLIYDFHQSWLENYGDNKKYWLRLNRHMQSDFWFFILEKQVLSFKVQFSKLSFDLAKPARGPGYYKVEILCSDPPSTIELKRYSEKNSKDIAVKLDKNFDVTYELKQLSGFSNCYYDLNIFSDC